MSTRWFLAAALSSALVTALCGVSPARAEAPAVWDVPNGTVNEAGATVLNDGHIDVASLLRGEVLVTQVKETTTSTVPVWRELERTVLQLLPGSKATVPAGDQWAFLGTAGSSFHRVTQTQQPGLLWPGWSTESIAEKATTTGVAWRLTGVTGPGEFALYQIGAFGDVDVLFNTRDGITSADGFEIPKVTHAHGTWAFSAEGNYCLSFERSTTLASGKGIKDSFGIAVAVGAADVTRVDPRDCQGTDEPAPLALTAATPRISGTAQVGRKLTAKPGSWKPAQVTLKYQWLRNGKKIAKATKSGYTLTATDKGAKITVTVTGSKSGYTTVAKTSAKTAKVKAGRLTATPTPRISGTAKVGKKLTAKTATWRPAKVKVTYQWYRNGKRIAKATKPTYTLTRADKGRKVTVKAKGAKPGYTTVTKTSKATAKVR